MNLPKSYRVQERPDGCWNCEHRWKVEYRGEVHCDLPGDCVIGVEPYGICDEHEKEGE